MKLRTGYLISGIVTGIILLFSFIWTLPDGKMHVVFCDVGQGDGAYIRFPDGRDMVIDGGPDDSIVRCLGRHMPFWDRHIDLVAMTHPQKDHMQGLISVLQRFSVDYFVRSDVLNATDGYTTLMNEIRARRISEKYIIRGNHITMGHASLNFIWPSQDQIAKGTKASTSTHVKAQSGASSVLGVTSGELNDYSLVFELRYGTFNVVFTGDADAHVEPKYMMSEEALRLRSERSRNEIEVLKVPHHGSKTGMTKEFIEWVRPKNAIISVGRNSYGHPSEEVIDNLISLGARVYRTDISGDIEVISDGKQWDIKTLKSP